MGHGEEPMPDNVVFDLKNRLDEVERQRDEAAQHAERLAERVDALRDKRPRIHAAMVKAMRLATSVGKDGFNEQQKYPFRGIDGTVNVLGPALREAGVFVTPEVLDSVTRDVQTTQDKKSRETTVRVKFTFWAEDGSQVSAVVPGESLDVSDKGTAKAMSVAFRIALLQVFALPTQEPSTDDNGHYHTRGGTPTLSGWTADLGRKILAAGTAEQVIDFWAAIVESSSIEAPSGAGKTITWGELTSRRLAEIVAEEQSPEVLRELWGQLKAADMIGLFYVGNVGDQITRTTLGDLVVEKGKQAKLNRDKAFDHCMELITSAQDYPALDAALVHAKADLDEGPLSREQYDQLGVIALERHAKLFDVDETTTPAPPAEFLPPVGEAWEQFVVAAGTPEIDVEQLDGLLTGALADFPPATDFGIDGVQRFIDAVKRAHSGYGSINSQERAELFENLQAHMARAGIAWHEEIK